MLELCIGLIWLKMHRDGGTCEYGNDPSVPIRCVELVD
jgi:hypothetical protein